MNILVAFKLCPNLDLLREGDIEIREKMGVDTHFLPNVLNCYDESALELALRLAEQAPVPPTLSAITLGGAQAELPLKTLRALGYQHTVHVTANPEQLRFGPETVAETLSQYLQEHPQTLVLLGREAPLGNHGAVPQLLSAAAGLPAIGSVVELLAADEQSVLVRVLENGSLVEQRIALPCILSIGNAVVSKLRTPTLRARVRISDTKSETFPLAVPKKTAIPQPNQLCLPQRRRIGYCADLQGAEAVEDMWNKSLKQVWEQR